MLKTKKKRSIKRPPRKRDLRVNQNYLKDWDKYQEDRYQPNQLNQTPILLPVDIGITPDGALTRELMDFNRVEKLAAELRNNLPDYMFNSDLTPHNPDSVFDDYIDYFEAPSRSQGPVPPTPLDLVVKMPVWTLFYLKPKAWSFSKDIQYSTVNDMDDMTRNFEKIATMAKNKALLISNRRRCAPKGLKFNLHVTITQKLDGRVMKTPIIIDPEQDNDQGTGGFW